MKKKLIAVSAILSVLLLVGVVFAAVGGIVIAKDKKYVKNAESVKALMSSVDFESEKCVLWYLYDGQYYEYEYIFSSENDDYAGKEVTVYFTKDAPENIFIETDEIYYIFLYIGIILTVISAVLSGAVWIPIQVRKYIKKNGKAELVRIEKITDVIGGKKILCDSTKIRGRKADPFRSKTLKGRLPKEIVNTAVTVYYLPKHKNFYYIDTDTIKIKDGAK